MYIICLKIIYDLQICEIYKIMFDKLLQNTFLFLIINVIIRQKRTSCNLCQFVYTNESRRSIEIYFVTLLVKW